jgi:hypothetical protein
VGGTPIGGLGFVSKHFARAHSYQRSSSALTRRPRFSALSRVAPPLRITRGGAGLEVYVRFTLSFRDVEDLLAERGIGVSYETVRRWVNHFGPKIAADLRKRRPKPHTIWHLDEVYLKIDGRLVYLWRAVDARLRES